VTDPEQKRKIIGREFIRAFEQAAEGIARAAGSHGRDVRFLSRARWYPTWSSPAAAPERPALSHHNVGGLPADLGFELTECCARCSMDESARPVSSSGWAGGDRLAAAVPGPGLAVRIIGEVTAEHLRIVRAADAIARAELSRAGLTGRFWQCPVVALSPGALGRRPGRRPQLRLPGRAPPGDQRGRDDRGTGPRFRATCWPPSPPGSPTR
jgi:GMP synthase (glutamine-hydrolysing)